MIDFCKTCVHAVDREDFCDNCYYCGMLNDRGIAPTGYEEAKKQTNADRIRSMTDEELAENLMKSYDCPKGKDCVERMPGEDGFQQCKRCWVEWLRQECE